ncbi:UNVERIFIED_CONTAM: hypothetical protein GTU68_027384 [Idotea baltica]|nr:hypothetical protein [Idotea baltica]
MDAWHEMRDAFRALNKEETVRVIVLTGNGKHFCSGIDLELLMSIQQLQSVKCEGRRREQLREFIFDLQDCITAIEDCKKPVIAAMHGGVIGGGVDITSACDLRYCSSDAYFTIKEVDMGLVADIGTMQRLPKIIPYSVVAELAFTGRKMLAEEAAQYHFVNRVYQDAETMQTEVLKLATQIAEKSPLVIRGTKQCLLHSRDHSVKEGLEYIALYNAAFLFSDDIMAAFQSTMTKSKPVFNN